MNQTLSTVLYLAVVIGLFYLLFLRPQQKQRKELMEMLAALKPGDRVMTSGGLVGIARKMDEEFVELELAPKVVVTVARGAIARKLDGPEVPLAAE
jgi:preprotein translocase subunit YajC